ncbi:Homeobox domain-containing protein/HALZ domain-containing protein [Cephalotus follicularis]|uniref:Homeobox domain-containing protein/HALZ domain-containing protein n=1 Tax=Cephalotus follicularis TaxID=3775 RepID=A0A1Q3AVR8_CEPFO|nr:Homeobox domain-containing protein/HALZ domain-containing protein [Cephalotus follicularis]
MDQDREECNVGLGLALGLGEYAPTHERQKGNKPMVCLDLSFTLYPREEADNQSLKAKKEDENYAFDPNKHSNISGRKKLRLTTEQYSLLEETFKLHGTLNMVQKEALADKLNLKPRQVEVWFQNRRARTKLKQTEADCEILKKRCERLSEDNKRLKRELQDLRSLKPGSSPLYNKLQEAAMCLSCEKFERTSEGKTSAVFDNNKLQTGFGETY